MSETESPYRAKGTVSPVSPSDAEEVASALAERLIQSAELNGSDADNDRAELAAVSRAISDLVAEDLVRRMEKDPMEVYAVFSNHTYPIWFASSRDKLIAGLEATQVHEPLVVSILPLLRTMQIRREALENASTGHRLRSVLTRPWVIAFVWLPAIALTAAAFSTELPPLRLVFLSIAVALFVVAFAVDARLRRCPSCHRYLAAMAVGARHAGTHMQSVAVTTPSGPASVNQAVDSYSTLWRCVHCKHRWG